MSIESDVNTLTVKVAELLVHVRAQTRTLNVHGKQLQRLDARADTQELTLQRLDQRATDLAGLPPRLAALEKWRWTIGGAYVAAGVIAGYLAQWMHR